ncbi:MAG TPA: Maf family protein [Candidatus Acidoferrales bacterium]|nr:Maf family protein [Candidatus Acidoferrales bacterium]
MNLILASTSPRRREIFALLGLPFEVIPPKFDELVSVHRPIRDEALEFAMGKARSIAIENRDSVVVASDTMIRLNERKFGKPYDESDARNMLRALAGKTHQIFTAVVIIDGLGGPGLNSVAEVSVRMRDYSDEEIERYLACGESLDKAGAYSIQGHGCGLIESIDGDYLAAVGLPLKPIAHYLQSRGFTLPLDVEQLYADKSFLNWESF